MSKIKSYILDRYGEDGFEVVDELNKVEIGDERLI